MEKMTIQQYLKERFKGKTLAQKSMEIFGKENGISILSKLQNGRYDIIGHSNIIDAIYDHAKSHGVEIVFYTVDGYDNSDTKNIMQKRDDIQSNLQTQIREQAKRIRLLERTIDKYKQYLSTMMERLENLTLVEDEGEEE